MSRRPERSPVWRGLDGLRAVAVVVVMCNHLALPHLALGGYLGVDVFFALSGFLITSLLLREWELRDGIDLRSFFTRRALRLLPAFFLAVAFACWCSTLAQLGPARHPTLAGVVPVVLYVSDITTSLTGNVPGFLGHMWSLAVEEQFYVLWPPLLLLGLRRGWRHGVMAGGLVLASLAEVAFRYVTVGWHPATERFFLFLYYGPWSHTDALLLGCAMALLLPMLPAPRRSGVVPQLVGLGALGLLVAIVLTCTETLHHLVWAPTVTALATLAVVACCVRHPRRATDRLLGMRPLRWIGQRSYGFYLYHLPLIYAVPVAFADWHLPSPATHLWAWRIFTVLVASLLVSAISYAVWERPFLRLKSRFARATVAAPATSTGKIVAGAAGRPSRPAHMAPRQSLVARVRNRQPDRPGAGLGSGTPPAALRRVPPDRSRVAAAE